jgi:ATP-binding cassette subfamily B protein
LKSLLEGFGISVNYGRLREACQTEVDGTSIDTIEEVARQLGLDANQCIVPADHLLLPEAGILPAVVVIRLPLGTTHFVVVWRVHGQLVQVMDPATGRRWQTREQFSRSIFTHSMLLSAKVWRAWAASREFLAPFRARLRRIGVAVAGEALIRSASDDPGWRSFAALDASTRMVDALVRGGGVRKGADAARVLSALFESSRSAADDTVVPATYWSASAATEGADGDERVRVAGAIVVQVSGQRVSPVGAAAPDESGGSLSPELVAALREPPSRPWMELLASLRADGILTPSALAVASILSAMGTVLEAVLFRGLFDVGRQLNIVNQRLGAFTALLGLLLLIAFIELPLSSGMLRIGRRLEARFRMALLRKIPRLGDRYFRSRLVSDMAERAHSIQELRNLPSLGGQLIRAVLTLVATLVGIAWIDPTSARIAGVGAVVAVVVPLVLQRPLEELDLRVRSHRGALGRHFLDALLGLVALRSHGAEPAVRREHESLLLDWVAASRLRDRAAIVLDTTISLVSSGVAGWIFLSYFRRIGEPAAALLLLYWALTLPRLGQEIALVARQYPGQRNVALRVLEPLGALEEAEDIDEGRERTTRSDSSSRGMDVRFESVDVRSAGHSILEDVNLSIEPGRHIAVVGPSGAGKSSLVGLLLGWHVPAAGRVLVDGLPLEGTHLEAVRALTAWVDPAIQIWNRSLLDNLVYGREGARTQQLANAIDTADLRRVLEGLPDGLATTLGEGGGLVSGGEGQRVRFARAVVRADARLVILDEPFRGLDRERRRELLARARRWWSDATLICITHDVGETLDFERVLVVDGGRIVEDDAPRALQARTTSRYAALLAAEKAIRGGLWSSTEWRQLRLASGTLSEERGEDVSDPSAETLS